MTNRNPLLIVGASFGLIAAGIAVRKLVQSPAVRSALFGPSERKAKKAHEDWLVDMN